MILVLIKPAKRLFTRRLQWTFEVRGANGERIDPRDTYNNRTDLLPMMARLFAGPDPIQMVVYDKFGNVEDRISLRD